jgi:uncharacterized protein (DUF1786 family)
MSRYLIVDVGAGTMDILYLDDQASQHYKAVARSPVLYVADKARELSGKIVVSGCEMGGGPITRVLKEKALTGEVFMSRSAALTIHHDMAKVEANGIRVVEDVEARRLSTAPGYSSLHIADIDVDRLRQIVEGLGVPFQFDVVGVCAQDHGMPPPGVSHLDYRHEIFKAALDEAPFAHAMLYAKDEVPATFNRLRSMGESAGMLPTEEIYVMDSGMAAILGASLDPHALAGNRMAVLDIATSHTVCAVLEHGEIAGFFEYHTSDITLERLEGFIEALADGTLDHRRILDEGGHGAYIRKAPGFSSLEAIIATGPKRSMLHGSRLQMVMGAPLGDNMMTGTLGVLEAIRRRKGFRGGFVS